MANDAVESRTWSIIFCGAQAKMVIRRTKYSGTFRAETLIFRGLLIALDHIEELSAWSVHHLPPDEAREGLMAISTSDIQARAILDMTLRRLTGLERDDKIKTVML